MVIVSLVALKGYGRVVYPRKHIGPVHVLALLWLLVTHKMCAFKVVMLLMVIMILFLSLPTIAWRPHKSIDTRVLYCWWWKFDSCSCRRCIVFIGGGAMPGRICHLPPAVRSGWRKFLWLIFTISYMDINYLCTSSLTGNSFCSSTVSHHILRVDDEKWCGSWCGNRSPSPSPWMTPDYIQDVSLSPPFLLFYVSFPI